MSTQANYWSFEYYTLCATRLPAAQLAHDTHGILCYVFLLGAWLVVQWKHCRPRAMQVAIWHADGFDQHSCCFAHLFNSPSSADNVQRAVTTPAGRRRTTTSQYQCFQSRTSNAIAKGRKQHQPTETGRQWGWPGGGGTNWGCRAAKRR